MVASFADLPLLDTLQHTLLAQGFTRPTEVQARVLPALLDRGSVAAVAQTGSGKTLSYVLPILHRLKAMERADNPVALESEPRALVLVPSRELGEQVARVFKAFTHDTRLRVRFALGGQRMRRSRDNVAGRFEVLVATPGRLQQLIEREAVSLDAVRFVVLDEADQLLDLGFLRQVVELVQATPGMRQLGLFSATMPAPLRELVDDLFPEATWVETAGAGQLVDTLRTRHVDVPDGKRFKVLPGLLAEPTEGGTLLFANTRDQADRVAWHVRRAGHDCAVLRGEMDRAQRRANLIAFREGTLPFLVATDMAARGLDIDHVGRVINVHLPRELDAYLHRAGRTARAGREGLVINLVTPRDAALMQALGAEAPTFPGR